MADGESRISGQFLMAGGLLLSATAFLYFYNLDKEDVGSEPEARILLTAQEMNRKGTWLIPTVAGEGRLEKPPLYVWTVKLASLFSNTVTPRESRIPGALAVLGLVMLAGWWAYAEYSRYPREDNPDVPPEGWALLTGLLVATSPEIFKIAREGMTDSLFSFFCFAALYCFGESFEMRRSYYASRPWRQWVLAGYALIGLGMMTKGPFSFLFVLIPYVTTCMAYRMRKPDWIHIPGVALALVIGGWWYAVAMMLDSSASGVFFSELFSRRFGPAATDRRAFYFYIYFIFHSFLPWALLSLAMVWRTLVRKERTPTRLMWTCALLSGAIWLSLVGTKKDEYFIPVAPFILLLAGDALVHWDFDGRIGRAFRILLRLLRWIAILGGVPLAIFLGSNLGIYFSLALAGASFALLFHRRRSSYSYAWWERTMQGAWLLVAVFYCAEVLWTGDYLKRKNFLKHERGFSQQVKAHLPENANLHLFSKGDSAVYSYYLGRLVPITNSVGKLVKEAKPDSYLLSVDSIPQLMSEPNLAAVVARLGGSLRPRSALFKVLPEINPSANPTMEDRYALVPPLRLAVLGDAGRDARGLKSVVGRVSREHRERPFHEILLLGDNFLGNSKLERLQFKNSFEKPYKRFLDEGLPLHGLLGQNDQQIASFLIRYPLIEMGGRRYYAMDFQGGLVRYLSVDALILEEGGKNSDAEWAWLEQDLKDSGAPWKIVAVNRPILNSGGGDKNDDPISDRLLKLLDQYHAQIVLWSSEPQYERIEDPSHFPVFFSVGWSGRSAPAPPGSDSRIKANYGGKPGYLSLEISPKEARFSALTRSGEAVDVGVVAKSGGVHDASEAGDH